eukprot:7598329-Pyramimonas_sp.AAC.1
MRPHTPRSFHHWNCGGRTKSPQTWHRTCSARGGGPSSHPTIIGGCEVPEDGTGWARAGIIAGSKSKEAS